MKTRSTQFDLLAEMCQYSTWRICVWLFPHIDNKIQIYLILFNTFDKLVAKFDKFALICIRFSPTFMKQFKQYAFDNLSNIHLMIRAKFIRWCTWPIFHIIVEGLPTKHRPCARRDCQNGRQCLPRLYKLFKIGVHFDNLFIVDAQ